MNRVIIIFFFSLLSINIIGKPTKDPYSNPKAKDALNAALAFVRHYTPGSHFIINPYTITDEIGEGISNIEDSTYADLLRYIYLGELKKAFPKDTIVR